MNGTLTPKQRQALQAVADGEVESINCGTAAFRICGANPSVIGRLGTMGLIRWTALLGGRAELTEAGRQAVETRDAR